MDMAAMADGAEKKNTVARASARSVRLAEMKVGEECRVARVNLRDVASRKRFAEVGIGPGTRLLVLSAGEAIMVQVGSTRLALGAGSAKEISVTRLPRRA